jgi:dTDP-4-amino-4,6-dideoxygalactose transaminase
LTLKVPFFRPSIGDEEINEVVDCLRSGWLTTGPKTQQFESDFSQFLGGSVECLAVNSCTSGLHLALEAIGVGPGDEVICPTLTFTATAEVIRYLGATPVLVDCNDKTFCISVDAIEQALTEKTKAVMPVHFAGRPCNMTAIRQLAKRAGIKIVADAAHAFPASHGGQLIGAEDADATVFSFYANKTITTGEGGMLVSSDKALIQRARCMRLHGIDRDVFNRFTAQSAPWRYDVVAPGYKYNMTDISAAMGIRQLRRADAFCVRRTQLSHSYDEALSDLPVHLPPHAAQGDAHSWHLYILRLADEALVSRDQFIEILQESGISCSVHYTPLHLLTFWRESLDLSADAFPNANRVFKGIVSLPLFVDMRDEEQEYVITVIRKVLSGR